jgi:glycosyltransferase involved in cell wall biosynthesis
MHIGLVAPPFIEVPPVRYGGTELFVAHLAEGLEDRGHEVTVYANGESRPSGRLKWRYAHSEWPVADLIRCQLKNADHLAWAIADADTNVDVIHLNDVTALPFIHLINVPQVMTLHHPHEPALSEQCARYPGVAYAAISAFQASREPMPDISVIPHGLCLEKYAFEPTKDDYLLFLGRMAPCKGPDLAIEAARQAGLRLKLAGEIQPLFEDYWAEKVVPLLDGVTAEYVGQADFASKNTLLSKARALLFPIQWDEPFGLVMIEAMACGTPVIAFPGGAVPEIVENGVSGWVCRDLTEMAARAAAPQISAASCRDWAAAHFSCDAMVDRYVTVYERVRTHAKRTSQPLPLRAV